MSHKFAIGQSVRLAKGKFADGTGAGGVYQIVRLIPETVGGENQYRIKAAHESNERMVREIELEATSPGGRTKDTQPLARERREVFGEGGEEK